MIGDPPRNPASPRRSHLASAWLIASFACGLCAASRLSAGDLPQLEEQAMKAAVARVAPSVVRIETVGGSERVGELLVGPGATTGLIVSEDGYIISSAFNFAQKPDSILVTLAEGRRVGAKLVATDYSRKLVLLKANGEVKLPTPVAVPRDQMRVGQWAIAVGRTYEGPSPNLSIGVISALDRVWSKAIQTDAKISPSNYGGPLVDISGRVLGVLAPLSLESGGDAGGVELYDSGIGFAIPLEDIQKALPRLERGEDLKPGLLGVSIKGTDLFSTPPVIAACRAGSPAHQAGFKAGDTIIEAGGKKITRQAELKHQLGAHYSGDRVAIAVDRHGERIEREIELTDKLQPYNRPFLGLLMLRPLDESSDLIVRYVFPDSPAAKAGVLAGDRVVGVDDVELEDFDGLNERVAILAPGEKFVLEVARGDARLKLNVELGRTPEEPPGELPAAHAAPPPAGAAQPPTGMIPIKTPEFANECAAYVPQNYRGAAPCGVVIWLHAPGAVDQQSIIDQWKPLCEKHDLILLAPKAADVKQWRPGETRFITRALAELSKTYKLDRSRIVAHGYQGGGSMAYLVALANPGMVSAVAAVEAPLPITAKIPESDPAYVLDFYLTLSEKSLLAPRIEATIAKLRSLMYPVTVKKLGEQARYLTPAEIAELARWIDSLDRL